MQTCNYLFTVDIFRSLEPKDFAALGHTIEKRTCYRGQIIYSQEDALEAFFLLKCGCVRLYRLTPSGKQLELGVIGPGTGRTRDSCENHSEAH